MNRSSFLFVLALSIIAIQEVSALFRDLDGLGRKAPNPFDNGFKHHFEHFDLVGHTKLKYDGQVHDHVVFMHDYRNAVVRFRCLEDTLVIVLNNTRESPFVPGQILVGDSSWGCISEGGTPLVFYRTIVDLSVSHGRHGGVSSGASRHQVTLTLHTENATLLELFSDLDVEFTWKPYNDATTGQRHGFHEPASVKPVPRVAPPPDASIREMHDALEQENADDRSGKKQLDKRGLFSSIKKAVQKVAKVATTVASVANSVAKATVQLVTTGNTVLIDANNNWNFDLFNFNWDGRNNVVALPVKPIYESGGVTNGARAFSIVCLNCFAYLRTSVTFKMKLSAGISGVQLPVFQFTVGGHFKANADVQVHLAGPFATEILQTIAPEISGSPIEFAIGPVPVIITPGLSFAAQVNLKTNAYATLSAGFDLDFTLNPTGLYRDASGNFNFMKPSISTAANWHPVQFKLESGTATARVSIVPRIVFTFYGLVPIWIALAPYYQIDMTAPIASPQNGLSCPSGSSSLCYTNNWGLEALGGMDKIGWKVFTFGSPYLKAYFSVNLFGPIQVGDKKCVTPSWVSPCHYWRTGDWSACSKQCASGTRTRRVLCVDTNGATLPDGNCTAAVKPAASEACNTFPCPATPGSAGTDCDWIVTTGQYIDEGSPAGNIYCYDTKPYPSLAVRQATCCRDPACVGFSYGKPATVYSGYGCDKTSVSQYLVSAPFFIGYQKGGRGTCAIDSCDYFGNDITNANVASPFLCCDLCTMTKNCNAWTWVTNTCYMKNVPSGVEPTSHPVSDNIYCARTNGKSNCIMDSCDYYGNDIGNANTADAFKCCDLCSTTSGCNAYTWVGNTCYMKSVPEGVEPTSHPASDNMYCGRTHGAGLAKRSALALAPTALEPSRAALTNVTALPAAARTITTPSRVPSVDATGFDAGRLHAQMQASLRAKRQAGPSATTGGIDLDLDVGNESLTDSGEVYVAGQLMNISWPTDGMESFPTITILLRADADTVDYFCGAGIPCGPVPNTGEFDWVVPYGLPYSNTYQLTFLINNDVRFAVNTPRFTVNATCTSASCAGQFAAVAFVDVSYCSRVCGGGLYDYVPACLDAYGQTAASLSSCWPSGGPASNLVCNNFDCPNVPLNIENIDLTTVLTAGDSFTIQWIGGTAYSNVSLACRLLPTSNYTACDAYGLPSGFIANQGNYTWAIAASTPATSQFQILITSAVIADNGDLNTFETPPFAIVHLASWAIHVETSSEVGAGTQDLLLEVVGSSTTASFVLFGPFVPGGAFDVAFSQPDVGDIMAIELSLMNSSDPWAGQRVSVSVGPVQAKFLLSPTEFVDVNQTLILSSCALFTSCATCNEAAGCGWCDSAGCVAGSADGPADAVDCPVSSAWNQTCQHTSFEVVSTVDSIGGCQSVCGDPHFRGLDGVRYEFQGEAHKTFALVSDPTVQINAEFIPARFGHTFLGHTCIRTCHHQLVVSPGGRIMLDGRSVLRTERWQSDELAVYRRNKYEIEVEIPGRWSLSFRSGSHVDIERTVAHFAYDNKTHGVLGHTMPGALSAVGKCNNKLQGGCEVEGSYLDYEVLGNICSTSWLHSKFNDAACA